MAAGRARGRRSHGKENRTPPNTEEHRQAPPIAGVQATLARQAAEALAHAPPHIPRVRLSDLDQTTVDTIGLALVACGLLLGFLIWTGSGAVGETVADVFRFLVGGVAYLVPFFLIASGIALAARERIESPARMRAGAIAIVLASRSALRPARWGSVPAAVRRATSGESTR